MRRLLAILLTLFAAPAAADTLGALRGGGLVIFLRHAETGPPHPDSATAVIGDCTTQRDLNETGRAQARAIGEAIRDLGIPVSAVLASPFCRTMETAALAFGSAVPEPALALPRHLDAAAHRGMGEALRALVRTPVTGGNLVLVGHSYHMINAGGPRPDPQGAAVVLRPDGDGDFTTLALIPPEGWPALARRDFAAR